MYLLPTLNFTLAVGGLVLLAATVVLIVDYFWWQGRYFAAKISEAIWPLIIGITVCSVALSLVYSEYFGFVPCSLCWLQRIAIYPQALLSLLAFRSHDDKQFPIYGIALSVFGLLVAVYQYVYQMLPKDSGSSGIMPCLVDGSNADCAVKVIDQFGFVTFPFISAVTFAFLIVVYLYLLRFGDRRS